MSDLFVNGYDAENPLKRRWNRVWDPFFQEIIVKFPKALEHDPCPCGLTLAIIPRANVRPELHYIIADDDLRDRVRQFIVDNYRPEAACVGADTVLILAEVA